MVNWVGTANGTVFAIDVGAGLVQAGGEFTTVDGRPHRFYARFATQELLSAPGELAHPDIELRAPFPNPAHSESQLRFELPSAERVTLSLLDVQGRRAQSLLEGLDEGRGAGRCDLQKANPGDFARQLRLDGVRRAEEAEGKGHEDSNGVEPSDSLRLMAPSMLVMPVDPADRDGHNTLLAVQDIACSPVFSPPVLQRQPNNGLSGLFS